MKNSKHLESWKTSKFKWSIISGVAVVALLIALFSTGIIAAEPITVSVNAPAYVHGGAQFVASVNTTEVVDLSALQFDVTYDPAVLQLTDVTSGELGGTTITTEWEWVPQGETNTGQIRVLAYAGSWEDWETASEVPAATGAGSLTELHFIVVGSTLETSNIDLSDGAVADSQAAEIPTTWVNASVTVLTCGDVNDDGEVNMADVMTLWYDIAEYPSAGAWVICNEWAADVNCDGKINMADVMILWYDIAEYPSEGAWEVNCCE